MKSLPFPRRIQLSKLLRAHGLRDVERMREDELKSALEKLGQLSPQILDVVEHDAPPSSASRLDIEARAVAPPPLEDFDDPHAAERFREPKARLPEGQRTFLRLIAVKPKLLFCTWDVATPVRSALQGSVELWLHGRSFLGRAPEASDIVDGAPLTRVGVDLSASGWYLEAPLARVALVATLVALEDPPRRIVTSNVALAPPFQPAPPGPLWFATLDPRVDRRQLASGELLLALDGGKLPTGAAIRADGETTSASGAGDRLPWSASLPSIPGPLPTPPPWVVATLPSSASDAPWSGRSTPSSSSLASSTSSSGLSSPNLSSSPAAPPSTRSSDPRGGSR